MVILNSSTINIENVIKVLNEHTQENNLKYINYDNHNGKRTLICNDGGQILRRKIALNLKLNVPTKYVFIHAYDPNYLFENIIKPSILNVLKEYNSLDIYIISTTNIEYINQCTSILQTHNTNVYLLKNSNDLEQRIYSDKGQKKIVLNFEPTCKYVKSDIFIYFAFLTSPGEMGKMFTLGINDNTSKYLIIDTLVQSCHSEISFLGSDRNDLILQKCITFYTLKNCPDTSKRVFQLISELIFVELNKHYNDEDRDHYNGRENLQELEELQDSHKTAMMFREATDKKLNNDNYDNSHNNYSHDDDDDEEDDDDDEKLNLKFQSIINSSTVCFVDQTDQQSYLLNYLKMYLGDSINVYNVDTAWWSLAQFQDIESVKVAIFAYTRSIPNFNTILAFVNAWKHLNRENTNNLICIILISPVILLSTREEFSQYSEKFQWLLNMASSVNCVEGLHSDKILKKQFLVGSVCPFDFDRSSSLSSSSSSSPRNSNLQNLSVLELVMKIFEDIETFIKVRENSQNPVFHENELLSALEKFYDRTIAEAVTASFLYRGIPLIGKDGSPKICVRLCERNDLFVIKNDNQKYINLSTITGLSFDNIISTMLNELNEQYSLKDLIE